MNTPDLNDPRSLLYATRLPGRLNQEQVAALTGFQPHDVPLIVKGKLLSPLGEPRRNAVKYYSAATVERVCRDERWLDRATKAILRGRGTAAEKDLANRDVPRASGTNATTAKDCHDS